MKRVFLLSKENIGLSKAEVEALAGKKGVLVEDLLTVNADFDFERLAYTKKVYDLLFTTTKKSLKSKIKSFNWQKIYKKSFCIRVFGAKKSLEKEFAGIVWEKIKNPKVNLEKPGTNIHFFFAKDKVFAGLLRQKIEQKGFEKRRPHLRPEMHPSSLHPRLARCLVNLTGIKKGAIIDPFCGTGGILLEAGLAGLDVEGSDIDENMLDMAKKNLKKFKIRHKLTKKDATAIKKKLNYVVSDLPYAKATKSQDLEKLYLKFFDVLKCCLQKKAVLGLPSFINNRKLLRKASLKIEKEFAIYIHKSLSKKIFVISS